MHRLFDRFRPRRRRARLGRRGVASILAMMFLVIFGSLAAAMAVVAQGNLRTADSGLKVSRAMSAAETGMVFATQRLMTESSKFVIDKGVIDDDFSERLWMGGPYDPSDGNVDSPGGAGYGIVHAVRDAHLNDAHSVVAAPGDQSLPTINEFGTLRVRPVALDVAADGTPNPNGPYFRLKYDVVVGQPYIRVTSQGVDGDIVRTLQMDYRITKKIEFAVLTVNRLMIGKNVLIEGPLGTRYGLEPGELDSVHGHPMILRSDYYYLGESLDDSLDLYFDRVAQWDVDGDGRLRINHPVESQGVAGTGFQDVTGDGYVDDFDLFLAEFGNGSWQVIYDAALAGQPTNFEQDIQLCRLVDFANADRDGDGEITGNDTALGYADGILDARDQYSKVRGRLGFAVSRSSWESAHGGESYQLLAVRGPIRPGIDKPPVKFEVSDEEMLEITTDMFADSQTWFASEAESGAAFEVQRDAGIAAGGTYLPPGAPGNTEWEEVPYGAPQPYDFYLRPVYEDMTFTNVKIPMGENALFRNCKFVGVTFIETHPDCTHENWNYSGAMTRDAGGNIIPHPTYSMPDFDVELADGTIISDTRPYSNNIRFENCTFLGSISGIRPLEYTHWRNKIQFSGETRFYLDPNDEDLQEQDDAGELQTLLGSLSEADVEELEKSSILMPGWSMDVGAFVSSPDDDPLDMPKIKLKGVIIAGVLDIRGNADLHGTLLTTFRPVAGVGPLFYQPNCPDCQAKFNTTIGYFGPGDGDDEGAGPDDPDFEGFGSISLRYNPHAKLPDGIPWSISMEANPASYTEGGSM